MPYIFSSLDVLRYFSIFNLYIFLNQDPNKVRAREGHGCFPGRHLFFFAYPRDQRAVIRLENVRQKAGLRTVTYKTSQHNYEHPFRTWKTSWTQLNSFVGLVLFALKGVWKPFILQFAHEELYFSSKFESKNLFTLSGKNDTTVLKINSLGKILGEFWFSIFTSTLSKFKSLFSV